MRGFKTLEAGGSVAVSDRMHQTDFFHLEVATSDLPAGRPPAAQPKRPQENVCSKRQILDAQVAFNLLKGTNVRLTEVICDYRHRHHPSASFSLVGDATLQGGLKVPRSRFLWPRWPNRCQIYPHSTPFIAIYQA